MFPAYWSPTSWRRRAQILSINRILDMSQDASCAAATAAAAAVAGDSDAVRICQLPSARTAGVLLIPEYRQI